METGAIIAFLEKVSAAPLPQNVRRSLEEWGAHHERIVVRRNMSLLQAIDAPTLDTLYADPALQRFLGRRLSPTAALVPTKQLEPLRAQLVAIGKLPALSEGGDAYPSRVLSADPAGRITFLQPLPSIFVRRALRPFTTAAVPGTEAPGLQAQGQPVREPPAQGLQEADGSLRLTPDSLRRGARSGMTAEQMIAILERFQAEPLPEEVPAMVRRWAKNWGRGTLAEVALLQVESAEIMADLLAEHELKPLLRPIAGAPTLATIQQDKMMEVRQLLEERGMDLEDKLRG
jgi:hypothetical protein